MKRGTYTRTPETLAKVSANSRRNWQDPEFRRRVLHGRKHNRYRFTAEKLTEWLGMGLGWSDIGRMCGCHHSTAYAAAKRFGVEHLIQPGPYRLSLKARLPRAPRPRRNEGNEWRPTGEWPAGLQFQDDPRATKRRAA